MKLKMGIKLLDKPSYPMRDIHCDLNRPMSVQASIWIIPLGS